VQSFKYSLQLKAKEKNKKDDQEKGFAIVSVIFAIMILGGLGLSMSPIWSTAARTAIYEVNSQQALHVAGGGMQYIAQAEFINDADFNVSNNVSPTGAPFGGTPITLGDGQFWVEYSNQTLTTADLIVTARIGSSIRKIQQTIVMNYPLGSTIGIGNQGKKKKKAGKPKFKKSKFKGNGILNGDVAFAGGSVEITDGFVVNGTITEGTTLVVADVDLQPIKDLTTSIHSGNLTINGDYTGNVYVKGKVIKDNAVITGIILADKDIKVEGSNITITGTLASYKRIKADKLYDNVTITGADAPTGEVLPVLVGVEEVKVKVKETAGNENNVIIQGLILSDGKVELKADQMDTHLEFTGLIYARGEVKLEVKDASSSLTVDTNMTLINKLNQDNISLVDWKEV